MKSVLFSKAFEDDLFDLFHILYEQNYLSTYEYAWDYVEDILTDIEQNIETKLKKDAPTAFKHFGHNLKYITYKRNNRTTWYIFFEERQDCYFVTYITNNHVSAHLIR